MNIPRGPNLFGVKALIDPYRRLLFSFAGGVLLLIVSELAKTFLAPVLSPWALSLLTIGFGALLVTLGAYLISSPDLTLQQSVLRAISEWDDLEKSKRGDREFVRALLDNLEDGVAACDASGKLILLNQMMRDWHGGGDTRQMTSEEWVKNYNICAADGITPLSADDIPLLRACKGETVHDVELVVHAAGQAPRHIIVNGGPFFDQRGKMIGAVITAHDVTRRKQAEEAFSEERRMVDLLMEEMPDMIYFKDVEGRFLRISRSQVEILGASDPAQVIGKTDFDFFSLQHAQAAYKDEREIIRTGVPLVDRVEELTWPGKPSRWVSATKMPLRDKAGNIIGTFGISRDITEREQAELALAYEQHLVQTLMDNIPDIIFFKDLQSRFIRVNAPAAAMAGLRPEEVIGKTDFDFFTPEYAQVTYATEQEIIHTGQPLVGDERLETSLTSPPRWVSVTKMPLRDETGEIIGTFGISRDVTARKRVEEQLLYLSTHDALTGLYNRAYFEDMMLQLNLEAPLPISIIIADIDGMKHTNDTYGHPAGDELLRRTASVLKSGCRADDMIARIGGDEFAILLPHTDHAAAKSVLERLRCGLAEHNRAYSEMPLCISLGVATAQVQNVLPQTVSDADREMYREKEIHHHLLCQASSHETE